MYASKLQTERSPVVKRVMVAETNTGAPKRKMTMYPERDYGWCCAPRTSWEKLTAKADAGAWVRPREITKSQVRMEGRLCEEMRGRRLGRGRRAATSRKDKLVEFGIDTKNVL